MKNFSMKHEGIGRLVMLMLAGIVTGLILTDAADQMRSGAKDLRSAVVSIPCATKTNACSFSQVLPAGVRLSAKLAGVLHSV